MVLSSSSKCVLALWLIALPCLVAQQAKVGTVTCYTRTSPCFLKPLACPSECPSQQPSNPKAKACYVNCNSPVCKAECKNRKPNCNGPGAACLDPRFIGGDGIVFYFHGKSNEHFALVSDPNLHINARFIGLRPAGRQRDFTWIQALGILFGSHSFSVEAIKAEKWDDQTDHVKLIHDGRELALPESYPSVWTSSDDKLKVERTSVTNGVLISLREVAEISINVVPITKEDDRVHNYRIPSDDCFAHLEVQFRFYGLSSKVEGVIGRTYQPDFVNPAKPGVAMPVVGGEDKYGTSSLFATDCKLCGAFDVSKNEEEDDEGLLVEPVESTVDCGGGLNSGNGIVCRK
ncbi:hypothetical protein PHJA_001817900 [Phtheirospermum japonicum]|uniref:Root cap n=1 Tax=Phtheirospermum japonicum TaxID=374723 RepID=A0A830CHV9_9LAMI|nr:hypothetical protein PHJA_001817900 [Phtheirospermum japonicum]